MWVGFALGVAFALLCISLSVAMGGRHDRNS